MSLRKGLRPIMSTTPPVRRRILFHIGGYDAISPERFHRRFTRELARSCATWSVTGACTPAMIDGAQADWTLDMAGPDWQCSTKVHLLGWDDLIRADFAHSHPDRLRRAAVAFFDLFASGTAGRYLRANWRYFLFFMFPLLEIMLVLALGWGVGRSVARSVPEPAGLYGLGAGALVVMVGYVVACRRYFLGHLLDDWIFACDYAHARRPDVSERIAAFGDTILAQIRANPADEVVIIGHSMGAMFMLEALDHVLKRDPEAFNGGVPVRVLAVGSSILKVALHPAAIHLRRAIASVAAAPGLRWVELQAILDVMNFYKIDPVIVSGAIRHPGARRPLIHTVRFSRVLSKEAVRRFFGNFFRLHNQFVMGSDKRYFYDYFLVAAGPIAFDTRFESTDTVAQGLGADGGLRADLIKPDAPRPERSKILQPLMQDDPANRTPPPIVSDL